MDTAQAMHDRGLKDAGYVYVNSDDVRVLATRAVALLSRCALACRRAALALRSRVPSRCTRAALSRAVALHHWN